MTLELGVARPQRVEDRTYTVETTLIRLGASGSMILLVLTGLQYVGLVHTEVTWFVVDQFVNGEARFNPNGDIHGDWGNQAHAVLVLPTMFGFLGAVAVTLVREFFTGTAD